LLDTKTSQIRLLGFFTLYMALVVTAKEDCVLSETSLDFPTGFTLETPVQPGCFKTKCRHQLKKPCGLNQPTLFF
jgi:hypothetical protein